ncbi:MAG: hypothetical protein KBH81_09690 [Phycisphaerae bacterium]|nr:hypothetical protein [Phycisphaerae bacterium]
MPAAGATLILTNNLGGSYIVTNDTTRYYGPLFLGGLSGDLVTMHVNANMIVTNAAIYQTANIIINNGGTFRVASYSGVHLVNQYGTYTVNSGGNLRFHNAATGGEANHFNHITIKSGGTFTSVDSSYGSTHAYNLFGTINVEAGGLWVNHGADMRMMGSAVVTNWGRIENRNNNNFWLGYPNNNPVNTLFVMQPGSVLLSGSSAAHSFDKGIYIGQNDGWAGPAGVTNRFHMFGGAVTNTGALHIGARRGGGAVRASSGELLMTDGTWINEGPNKGTVLIGGWEPWVPVDPTKQAATYADVRGVMTQSGGLFRTSATNIFVANGPSVGFLTIGGTAQFEADNSNLIIGSKTGNISDYGYGTFTLNGGTVSVKSLLATGGVHSVVAFNGGTLNTAETAVNTGSALTVGNGTDAAVLNLLGGTHSFADGLRVAKKASLTGTGTIQAPDLTIQAGGLLSIGASPGSMTATGNVTFASGSFFAVDLFGLTAGTDYDQLTVGGDVNLGGSTLQIDLGSFTPDLNDTFTIIQFSGALSGQFAQGTSISSGGTDFSIGYMADSVVLTVIPEPGSLLLGLIGLALLLRRKLRARSF